jgi:uncharacterized membrane protein YkgB
MLASKLLNDLVNKKSEARTPAPSRRGSGSAAPPWVLAALQKLRPAEDAALRWSRRHGITILRVGLGVVFFWFGVLKLFPGLSPAQELITSTITFVDPRWFLKVLAVWEMAIGLGLITGAFLRVTLLLFFFHLPGTALPLILLPSATWTRFPFGLTLEGQYIVKNLVLAGAALVIAGASRRRRGAHLGADLEGPLSLAIPPSIPSPSQR